MQPKSASQFSPSSGAPRRRSGCLGCLPRLFLGLLVGCVLVLMITAVFAPWGFFLGGKFHILPWWQGWGTLNADSGKYLVYVQFSPSPSGSKVLPGPSVRGNAWLCSPRGETFRLRLGGGMPRGIGRNTEGKTISLYANYYRPFLWNMTTDRRPEIEIRGEWHGDSIVANDHGSVSRSFNADGTVTRGKDPHRAYPGPIVAVTLNAGSYGDFKVACQASSTARH